MTAAIKAKALELGYSSCGIIPAEAFTEFERALEERIQTFPESKERYEWQRGKGTPPENAKSIIVCVCGYNHYKFPGKMTEHFGKYYLAHSSVPYSPGFRMKAEFEAFLQVSGLRIINFAEPPARWAAVKAGLGKFSRNNFFYTNENGSYNGIDVWTVDAELDYDSWDGNALMPGCTENCRKCIDACPTKAMSGDFAMDCGKCVAFLMFANVQKSAETEAMMGRWLYGCDACQDVCPLNKGKLTEEAEFPLLAQYQDYVTPEAILAMDEETFANIMYPRFPRAGKDGFVKWKDNAKRAVKNKN